MLFLPVVYVGAHCLIPMQVFPLWNVNMASVKAERAWYFSHMREIEKMFNYMRGIANFYRNKFLRNRPNFAVGLHHEQLRKTMHTILPNSIIPGYYAS